MPPVPPFGQECELAGEAGGVTRDLPVEGWSGGKKEPGKHISHRHPGKNVAQEIAGTDRPRLIGDGNEEQCRKTKDEPALIVVPLDDGAHKTAARQIVQVQPGIPAEMQGMIDVDLYRVETEAA